MFYYDYNICIYIYIYILSRSRGRPLRGRARAGGPLQVALAKGGANHRGPRRELPYRDLAMMAAVCLFQRRDA